MHHYLYLLNQLYLLLNPHLEWAEFGHKVGGTYM